jgi:hypothetical protein
MISLEDKFSMDFDSRNHGALTERKQIEQTNSLDFSTVFNDSISVVDRKRYEII